MEDMDTLRGVNGFREIAGEVRAGPGLELLSTSILLFL